MWAIRHSIMTSRSILRHTVLSAGQSLLALLVLLALAITLVPAAQAQTADPLLSERILGSPEAPITIIDYSSLTCPHCAKFHTETLPKIKEAYLDTGKAKLIYRDFPFDGAALRAGMLARCIAPDRYFGLLDVLFRTQHQWAHTKDPTKALAKYGKLAGMSDAEMEACFANTALADKISQNRIDGAKQYNIESTPTFIFNEGAARLSGARPFEDFAAAIEKLGTK